MVVRIVGILSMTFCAFGQEEEIYIQPNLLKGSATITPSDMLASDQSNYYISGFLEYHLTKNLSVRGESYIHVDGKVGGVPSLENVPFIEDGVRTFFGASYHLNKGNFDYNIGFQPGISVIRYSNMTPLNETHRAIVSPSLALQTGVSFFVWKYFHFFANITYVRSPVRGVNIYPSQAKLNNADELMFSAGLGFHIQTKKK